MLLRSFFLGYLLGVEQLCSEAEGLWKIPLLQNFCYFLMFTHHIRDIKDPEHPYSLEELKVITEDAIEVDDKRSYVR